jgi:putative flippase GtrA
VGLLGLLSRFGLSGLINTGVGFAVIAGLDLGLGIDPRLANAAGYAVGMALGFGLNRVFVFRHAGPVRAAGPRYLAAVAAAFLLNQAVLALAGRALGDSAAGHAAAQIAAMSAYTAALFLLSYLWVFREGGRTAP